MHYADTPLYALQNWLRESGATITCSTERAAFPAANLLEEDPSLTLRTDDVTGAKEIVADCGVARAVDLAALPLTNLTEAATTAFYGSANGTDWTEISGTWGGLQDSRPNGGERRNMLLFLCDETETYRYWKWSLTDAANADGFIEAAFALLAPAVQTAIAQEYGSYEVGTVSTDDVRRTPGGAQHRYAGGRAHVVALKYEWLSETEAMETFVEGLDYALGATGSIVLVLEPNDEANWWRQAFWCFVAETESASHPHWQQWSKSYTFEEIVP